MVTLVPVEFSVVISVAIEFLVVSLVTGQFSVWGLKRQNSSVVTGDL